MKKLTVIMICLALFGVLVMAEIVVVSPGEGDKITMNFPFEIKWKPPAVTGDVKIRLFQNNTGLGAITMATENDGSFSWRINQLTNGQIIQPGEAYQVKIISVDDAEVTGLSGVFALRKVILKKRPPLVKKKPSFELLTDLEVVSITMSDYDPTYKTTFTVNVKNNAGATTGPVEILFWLYKVNSDGSLPGNAEESWSGTVPENGGNIGYQVTVSWSESKYGPMTNGNWRAIAKLNPKQTIPETTLENNQLTFDFTITN